MIRYILFDLDNTLYPESSPMGANFENSINSYVARYLGVSPKEAKRLRRERARDYGTTLQWLCQVHDFDRVDEYMEAVHPVELDKYLKKNPDLVSIIRALPMQKSILTNSPREHAERVLEYLEIYDEFEHLFDLRYNNFVGKPDPEVYRRILTTIGHAAEETLFIDDVPGYLEPFREMGGQALLIDELGRHSKTDYPVIQRIEELPKFLEEHFGIGVNP